MAVIKKYSYKDWWNGKIYLIYSPLSIPPDNKVQIPPSVSWKEIVKTDIPIIKKKQEEIFNNKVSMLLKIWKESFSKRFANSKLPEILLKDELNKFNCIMLAQMPLSDGVSDYINYCGVNFLYNDLSVVKNYIDITKVNGTDPDFDFMHSSDFLFQTKGVIPEVYAESCWQYAEWLMGFQSTSEINKKQNESEDSTSSAEYETSEPKNPFPLIFKNGHAYNMFLDLKKIIVQKKTELADYSFIYRSMKSDDLAAINSMVTHTDYIRFLNTKQGAEIISSKLNFSKTRVKEQLYNSVFEKYRSLISVNTHKV